MTESGKSIGDWMWRMWGKRIMGQE